ncbi:MAG: S41 family peptidase [Bacteroidales bacterium]|nr:S41 family peptidase [Bacteroidales bacterium]
MKKLIYFIALLLVILPACEPDSNDNNSSKIDVEKSRIRGEIYAYMQSSYYWNDKIPQHKDTTADIEPEEFFYSLLYTALDRWSFITTQEELLKLDNGQYYGHGIMFTYDEYANIRVGYVYKNTWASEAGIRRGWVLKKVNDQEVHSYEQLETLVGDGTKKVVNKFEFIDNEGNTKIVSIEKEEITINPVLSNKIIQFDGKKVGYLALESFLGSNIEGKLDDIFNDYKTNSIDELIIDLRYNTGGSLYTANHLANLVVGNVAKNQLFIRLAFNPILEDYYDDSIKISYINAKPNSLTKPLSRVFFITSGQTASASEALIKGIQPYLTTILIGTRTYGKPVGMIPVDISNSNYVIVPVMFEWKNAQGESSGYMGIGVNQPEFDDLTRDFGDTTELCLHQAIRFIKTGNFAPLKKSAKEYNFIKPDWKGIRAEIGAY